MDLVQRAIVAARIEVTTDGALGRQILRNGTPLASRAQRARRSVDDFPRVDLALAAPAPGRWDGRLDMPPFLIARIARTPPLVPVASRAVLDRPHRGLLSPRSSAP